MKKTVDISPCFFFCSICNLLLENPDYPRKENAVLAHSSSLLEPSEETQVCDTRFCSQTKTLFPSSQLSEDDQRKEISFVKTNTSARHSGENFLPEVLLFDFVDTAAHGCQYQDYSPEGLWSVSQESENYFDFSKLKQVSPSIVMQASDMLMRDFRMLSCQDLRWTLNSLKGHYAITRKVFCQTRHRDGWILY